MPKYVTEIAQGNTYSIAAENGSGAYTATRAWKVILNTPDEVLDITTATGVSVGTPYSTAYPIPCVSIEGRPDGESRLVKIITATYRTTPGTSPTEDPKTQPPTARPALYSMTTSLSEVAAWGGKVVSGGSSGPWIAAANPVGDLVDGITRLEPVVNIQIEQYSVTDQSAMLGYTGYVNSDSFSFSSLAIGVHCCMLQGISSNPIVEQFGESLFRGFKVTFNFAVRAHYTYTRNGPQAIGWDIAVPQTGLTIINSGLGDSAVEQSSLVLALDSEGKVILLADESTPAALAKGTAGKKCRAQVPIAAGEGMRQTSAAQPVALNDNGTPRSRSADPPVLINRICLQPEMSFGNNFSAFGINSIS